MCPGWSASPSQRRAPPPGSSPRVARTRSVPPPGWPRRRCWTLCCQPNQSGSVNAQLTNERKFYLQWNCEKSRCNVPEFLMSLTIEELHQPSIPALHNFLQFGAHLSHSSQNFKICPNKENLKSIFKRVWGNHSQNILLWIAHLVKKVKFGYWLILRW